MAVEPTPNSVRSCVAPAIGRGSPRALAVGGSAVLYRLSATTGALGTLEPLPFLDAADLQQREKDLENLMAAHLLDVLFEDAPLLAIFQERQLQAEADLYAVDRNGDLVIFELKRGAAGEDAALQAIGYAQRAGRWMLSELQHRYDAYLEKQGLARLDLRQAHRDAFQLEHALEPSAFNRRQHLYIVGSAANERLIDAIDYWKIQGLSVEFLPYRIYEIQGNRYFEFFSFPYDRHRNPATAKGVLFDTNRTYDENSVWEMMEKGRVAAYGDLKYVVEYLNPGDIVFFYHKGPGIVAAGVVSGPVRSEGDDERYREIRFLTPVPSRAAGIQRAMAAAQVSQATAKSFFWARTIKVPYLDRLEAQSLLSELNKVLSPTSNDPLERTGG